MITTVAKPRVHVVILGCTIPAIIILWLHSLSGVIRSLLCKPRTFSPAMITYTTADHRRMRLRGNVYRSSITDVKRRYTKHCNVNKMADSSGLGPGKFITLLTL